MEYATRVKRWTRAEYDRLIEVGVFRPGDPIELLAGELVVAESQGSEHYTAICLADEALKAAFGPGWLVRPQGPVALDDESEPEPDLAVAPGTLRDYRREHPARPVLVVEVSESSLRLDRNEKSSLYARARLEDYWIVNGALRLELLVPSGARARIVGRAARGPRRARARQRPPALAIDLSRSVRAVLTVARRGQRATSPHTR